MSSTDKAPLGVSHGEQTTNSPPPPLRRSHSSLRLLTELTRERIALRCDCHSSLTAYSATADQATAISMPGPNCTNLNSSSAMHSRIQAPYLRRRHVSTAVLLPLHSSQRCALESAGPL